jgi:ribonuclease P protein component
MHPEPSVQARGADRGLIVIARLVRSADFERVLGTRNRANSTHFAVHHIADRPSNPAKPQRLCLSPKLSTAGQQVANRPVDDLCPEGLFQVEAVADTVHMASHAADIWLGAVVPKRHARRSVTRTMLKRQIRAVVQGNAASLAGGLWVVRLRAPFDRVQFVSATSDALRRVAHAELDLLIRKAAQRSVAG